MKALSLAEKKFIYKNWIQSKESNQWIKHTKKAKEIQKLFQEKFNRHVCINTFLFEEQNGKITTVTVNQDRYQGMITRCFIPELMKRGFEDDLFQQRMASSHCAKKSMDLLYNHISRVISRKARDQTLV